MRALAQFCSPVLARFRRWAAPPIFADDQKKTRMAALLNTILWLSLALWLPWLLLVAILRVGHPVNLVIAFGANLIFLGLLVVMRRGRVALAAGLAVAVGWATTTAQIYNIGTLYSVLPVGYFVLALTAAWVLGLRVGAWVCLLNIITLGGLAYAETHGLLPPPVRLPAPNFVLTVALALIFSTLLMGLARASVLRALAQAHAEIAERQRAEAALRDLNATLEGRVAERTAALRASEARYRSLLTLSPDGISVVDITGRILTCNDQFARMYGYDHSAEMIGKHAQEFVRPEVYAGLYRQLAAAFTEGNQSVTGIEFEALRRDGTPLVVAYSVARVPWPEAASSVAFLSTSRDVTQHRAFLKELEEYRDHLEERVKAALARRMGELSVLQDLGHPISLTSPLPEMVRIFLGKLVRAVGLDMAQAFLLRDGRLHLAGVYPPSAAGGDLVAVGERLCGLAVGPEGGQTVYVADAGHDPRCAGCEPHLGGLRSLAAFPLCNGEAVIGALALAASAADAFADQLAFLETSADLIAVRLQNALLHQALQERAAGLEETVAERTRELQTERDRTQAILETMEESVVVTDLEGQILFANPATARLTGYARDETVGSPLWHSWSPGSRASAWPEAQRALRSGQIWHGEIVGRRKDSSRYIAELTAAPLYEAGVDALPTAGVWVQRDITLLKEVERLKDQFISNVSHELRTPISVIALSCDNLVTYGERLSESQRQQMLQDIHEQAHLLSSLVENILQASQIEGRRLPGAKHQVDLARLVREEVEKQGPFAARQSQQLSVTTHAAVAVLGDELQLRQVVRNLLDNALKYTPAGGQIRCVCEIRPAARTGAAAEPSPQLEPWAVVEVTDTGIGIAAGHMPFLFERFYRVNAESEVPGTGLGLSIAHELVLWHGGWINVTSAPGQGSTFTVYLPLAG